MQVWGRATGPYEAVTTRKDEWNMTLRKDWEGCHYHKVTTLVGGTSETYKTGVRLPTPPRALSYESVVGGVKTSP